MLVIDLSQNKNNTFASVFHLMFYDYACDYNIEKEKTEDGWFYGTPMELFIPLVEIWALQKYDMKLKFIKKSKDSIAYGMIVVGWGNLSKEECKNLLINMYPETEQ